MSQDSERLKALVNFKKKLEKQIEELSSELEESQGLLEAVNSVLLEKGFKRGDLKEVKPPEEEEPPTVHVKVEVEAPPAPKATEPGEGAGEDAGERQRTGEDGSVVG